ncbi:unnamed protein product [Rotaria sp. Silwood2]|nr:unnamed protein product [Rotaria sp. Silwood2]CAF3091498.1 unnamed protein product [Rotaria sp. Silwood2]CAF3338337.1 unnamed protein product [Rotaria sp. Silwood2]CAF3423087.1 unnamed protein product [Rotaria sp. Silwood2]CAF4114194.1 unnamed protein product [Rotaria sp. Silwood2]
MFLYAWATIERHILIFHNGLMSTRTKVIFVHYLPPIIIIVYCLVYYTTIFFVVECENNFDSTVIPSFYPCASENNALYLYETTVNAVTFTFIVVISSVFFLIRVLWQKYRMHQQFQWRRYRFMIIHILSISSIYLLFLFPYMIVTILNLCGLSSAIINIFLTYIPFLPYYTLLLFPIIIIGSLPELSEKIKEILQYRRQRRTVAPVALMTTRGQKIATLFHEILLHSDEYHC